MVNHEYTDEPLMFPADTYTDEEIKGIAMHNHGMSVLRVRRGATPGSWKRVTALRAAPPRTAGSTSAPGSGSPARRPGDERLRTTADPSGHLRARHPQQLRRRHDAVGHGALGRGELQPVLRQVRRARRALHRGVRPLRRHRHRQAAGATSTRAST